MKQKILLTKALVALGFLLSLSIPVSAQWKDNMGGNWNNPTSASIGNIINDRLWNRMRAKARARRASGNSPAANSRAPEAVVADPAPEKKSAAQITAATRFRSTGTQLTTRELANASGNTAEEKEQLFKIMGAALGLYETEARRLGRPNDFALALAVALAFNGSVYNGTPEPSDARLFEIGDAIGELMAENNVFGGITDRQKQEMYESMVIFTMLVQVGANEAKQSGDASGLETYRQLAGKVLQNISGMPPEKIRLDAEAATVIDNPAPTREESSPAPAANAATMHAAALVKEFESNEVRANQLYAGKRMRIFGTVNSIEIGKDGRIVLTFKSSIATYGNARCYFSKSQGSRVATINAHEEATVEGTVRGWEGGYDNAKVFVLLENCIVP
jgi:uncharacterized protein DUF6683/putative nucleic acid binding protein